MERLKIPKELVKLLKMVLEQEDIYDYLRLLNLLLF